MIIYHMHPFLFAFIIIFRSLGCGGLQCGTREQFQASLQCNDTGPRWSVCHQCQERQRFPYGLPKQVSRAAEQQWLCSVSLLILTFSYFLLLACRSQREDQYLLLSCALINVPNKYFNPKQSVMFQTVSWLIGYSH